MRLNLRSKRVFIRFFISYIAILLMPIIIGSFTYAQILAIVVNETEEKNGIILEQGRGIVDGYMASVEKIVQQMTFDPRLIQLMQAGSTIEGMDIYRAFEAQRNFSLLNVTNDFIANFYIYFRDSNMIITKDTIYSNPELFYRSYLNADMEGYTAWLDRMASLHSNLDYASDSYLDSNGGEKMVIASLQSIPTASIGSPKGCITILLDESKIRKLLDPISTDKGGWFYITDSKGNILSSTQGMGDTAIQKIAIDPSHSRGTSIIIQDKKMLVTYSVSEQNNWRYVSAIPLSVVMAKVEYVKSITVIIALLILITGIIIALMAAYQNNKPIKRMITTLSGKLEVDLDLAHKNEYDILEGNLVSLIDNNQHLKAAMQEQVVLIKATFFERLIKGQFRGRKELEAISSLSGIEIRGSGYAVIMIQFIEFTDMIAAEYLDELERKRVLAKNVISNCIAGKGFVHDSENDKIMLLLSFTSTDGQEIDREIEEIVHNAKSELKNLLNARFAFAVGNFYSSLLDVYKSYNEACQALDCLLNTSDENVFWYSKISWGNKEFYFPLEVQVRLFYLVKAGEKEDAERLLQEIYEENFVHRQLSEEMTGLLVNELYATYIRARSQLKIKEDVGNKELSIKGSGGYGNKAIKEWYTRIQQSFCRLCEIVSRQKKNYNNQLVDEVTQYINENYTNPQLSLSDVASRFGLTEANLSYYFKERAGENFSTYIENLRIEQACELLRRGEHPINEISELVGYNSDHSFRRAFKRIKCISPTDFRKEILRNKL